VINRPSRRRVDPPSAGAGLAGRWPARWPLRPLDGTPWARQEPTFSQARPGLIAAALERAEARPSGNWYVFAAGRAVRPGRPYGFTVAGVELVAWRDRAGRLLAGPGACPHLGAPLADARVDEGALLCRWHGMRLDADSDCGWRVLPAHDDGVLAWVRLDGVGGEPPSPAPVLPSRPAPETAIDAVAMLVGVCEPGDVIANRLDPWHGAWFHPYSFAHLRVLRTPDDADDRFVVEVTFRVAPRLGVPVIAEFTCPEPRTIVMRITDGEGAGSVVETHATPLGPGADGRPRTAVIEAVIAGSGRPGFRVARNAATAVRPLIRRAATRLWRDDLAYAERRYLVRSRGDGPPLNAPPGP
jgi:nitrite reductase/ring-hydroxylating ferredoxin subunit